MTVTKRIPSIKKQFVIINKNMMSHTAHLIINSASPQIMGQLANLTGYCLGHEQEHKLSYLNKLNLRIALEMKHLVFKCVRYLEFPATILTLKKIHIL